MAFKWFHIYSNLMGGGSSKEEENQENKKNEQQQNIQPTNNPNLSSPLRDINQQRLKKNNMPQAMNHYNHAQLNNIDVENRSNRSGNSSRVGISPQNDNPRFFAGWSPMFQTANQLNLKICIMTIEPTFQIKNLNKKQSEHQAKLSWQYEYIRDGKGKSTFLRFYLQEDGGFKLTFLLNEEAECVQGNQTIWRVLCPFRTNKQSQKVGGYICERIYESNQNNYNDNDENRLQADVFYRWEEKPIRSRASMRKILQNKRMIEDLKNQKGFEYSQTTKYFNTNQDWKFNSFKSWIVEINPGDQKQMEKTKAMSVTLRNDVQTRESMYIDEMRKKRDIIEDSKKP